MFVFFTLFSFSPDISDILEKDQLQDRCDKLSNNYTQLQETVSGNNNKKSLKTKRGTANMQYPRKNVCIILLIIFC